MNFIDDNYYMKRSPTDAHRSSIRNLGKTRTDQCEKVVHAVFRHQPAAYIASKGESLSKNTLPAASDIASYFYNECYLKPNIHKGISKYGATIEINQFIEKVVLSRNSDDERNEVYYLLGDVGVGKTAFINYLITKYNSLWRDNNMWFIRVDLDPRFGKVATKTYMLLNKIADKTARVIDRNPGIVENDDEIMSMASNMRESCVMDIDENDKEAMAKRYIKQLKSIKYIVKGMKEKFGRRLFLVIDNLDYICHVEDYGLFKDDHDAKGQDNLLQLCNLPALFLHPESLRNLEANILFVMRDDTYTLLKQTSQLSWLRLANHIENTHAFTIESPSWEDVLTTRSKLLEYVVSRMKLTGKRKEYEGLIEIIKNHALVTPENQPALIEHLREITNYGLREVVDYFSQYAWLPTREGMQQERGIERFINQYPVGLLTYLLGKMKRFSQENSLFPNIYLPPRRSILEKYNGAKCRHTYWLKRLILQYVFVMEQSGEQVIPSKIVQLFQSGDARGYQEPMVRASLGCLTDSRYSRLLAVSRSKNDINTGLEISGITLTPRGKHIINDVCDRFIYLQLIVDDYSLPIPRKLQNEYRFPEDSLRRDYGYVVLPGSEYAKYAKIMIKEKAKQVLLFLNVLEESLKQEMEINDTAFSKLDNRGIRTPDIKNIRGNILHELKKISASFGNFMNVAEINAKARGKQNEIRSFIREAYMSTEEYV